MFEGLTNKISGVLKTIRGYGKINEENIQDALRKTRLALLEADVNFKVVKEVVENIRQKAVGQEITRSLTPDQMFLKIFQDELTAIMGGEAVKNPVEKKGFPTVIMLCGLQGSGKTTTAVKLAVYLKSKGHKATVAAADVYRPAAIKQLQTLCENNKIDLFEMGQIDPVKICSEAVSAAKAKGSDFLILDTAGRLHVDGELMEELSKITKAVKTDYIFFAADSMTGQDAVTSALAFHQKLNISGVILTKLDGDARGGAALSIKYITGTPVVFSGLGEKITDFDVFYPDRMAQRILGLGDVVGLIEKVQDDITEEDAKKLEKKMLKGQFTFQDFLDQLKQIKKMGPIENILAMLPGMGGLKTLPVSDKDIARIEAVILSMTREERINPKIIEGSRKKRMASGSGASVQQINQLLNQFFQMQKMMSNMGNFMKKFKGFDMSALTGGGSPFGL